MCNFYLKNVWALCLGVKYVFITLPGTSEPASDTHGEKSCGTCMCSSCCVGASCLPGPRSQWKILGLAVRASALLFSFPLLRPLPLGCRIIAQDCIHIFHLHVILFLLELSFLHHCLMLFHKQCPLGSQRPSSRHFLHSSSVSPFLRAGTQRKVKVQRFVDKIIGLYQH